MHSEIEASTMDKKQKSDWWDQRQCLDDDVTGILAKLEALLGSSKRLLCGVLADADGRASAQETAVNLARLSGSSSGKQHTSGSSRKSATINSGRLEAAGGEGGAVVNALRVCVQSSSVLSAVELEQGLRDALWCDVDEPASSNMPSEGVLQKLASFIRTGIDQEAAEDATADDEDEPAVNSSDLMKLKVGELRARLVDLDLPTAGLKKDLVQRIVDASAASRSDPSSRQFPQRRPVILVLDEKIQRLPWEGMEFLRRSPVSRVPSVAFVLAHGRNSFGGNDLVKSGVNLRSGHYILDPDGNLPRTRAALSPLVSGLAKKGWTGVAGKPPTEDGFK